MRWVAILSFVCLLAAERTTSACSCAFCMPPAVVPNDDAVVARNTHLWVLNQSHCSDDRSRPALELRRKGHDLPIPLEVHHGGSGDTAWSEYVPKALLPSRTSFDVFIDGQAWTSFSTSDETDTEPPLWDGVTAASEEQYEAVCCNCSTDDPWIRIDFAAVRNQDEFAPLAVRPMPERSFAQIRRMPAGGLVGIWLNDDARDVDGTPPTLLRLLSRGTTLGRASTCAPEDIVVRTDATPLRVVVRPIDVAGNRGRASEFVISQKPGATAKGSWHMEGKSAGSP